MKKIFWIFCLSLLTACANKPISEEIKPTPKALAPIEFHKLDYDSFYLNGKTHTLPTSYEDFKSTGISLDKNEYYHDTIGKNQQAMTTLKGDGYNLGATFKNTKDKIGKTEDGTIIEVYVNSNNDMNKDFRINNLGWGSSFKDAKKSLSHINTDEAYSDMDRTLSYSTDKNYVSLYFTNDKLVSAAIFARPFMRDENYIDGEFVVFGQTVKFPITLTDLENLLTSSFTIEDDRLLDSGEETAVKIYSPMFDNIEDDKSPGGLDFYIKNTSVYKVSLSDAEIIEIKAENSSDLSIGNIYVGASIDEIMMMDKRNQKPMRLSMDGMTEDGEVKYTFWADNHTVYIFYTDKDYVTRIEIINKE